MNTLKTIYDKLGDKTELAKHEVELAVTDDIAFSFKNISKINADYNKLDSIVQKNIVPLNTAYKQIVLNKDYAKKMTPVLDKQQATLIKLAKDLGVDYKQIPAFKQLMDTYDFVSQIDDSINNAIDAVKNLGK